ncbi:MAG: 50S ribosomal protein L23 [Candidatus Paceibacterota bacterium]|jgi:large subunit ribosomal protein L23
MKNLHAQFTVLRRPRITEKATMLAERVDTPTYTFEIDARANKAEVVNAVKKLFGVTPKKVAITTNPRKAVVVRGKAGFKGGVKKAVIYLKKGDKIEIA